MKKLLLMALLSGPLLAAANQSQSISTPMPTSNFQGSVSYFGYYSGEAKDFQKGNAGLYTYHLLALSFKIDSRFTLSLRPTFTHETAGIRYGQDLPAETQFSDSHLALVDRNPFTLPAAINSKITYKIYLPTDPEWQKAGAQGAVGADLEFSRDLDSRYSVGYYPKGFFLIQNNSTYLSTKNGNFKIKATQSAQLEQWIRLTRHLGDRVSISQGLGLKSFYYNAETETQIRQSSHPLLETNLNLALTDDVDVILGLGQQSDPRERPWRIYNEEETSYVIMTSVRI